MLKINKLVIVGCAGVGGTSSNDGREGRPLAGRDIDKRRREFLFAMRDPLYLG